MLKNITLVLFICVFVSCNNKQGESGAKGNNPDIDKIFDNYWEERMQLFPLEATANGDNRYNDKLTITISNSFRDSLKGFYGKYLAMINEVDSASLDDESQISYSLFKYEMKMNLEGLNYPTHLIPINQFWAFTLDLPQLGSGTGNQPFKTPTDYDAFLKRLAVFPAWIDTAIVNMREGIKQGWVLPKPLVVKILPQVSAMLVKDIKQSVFYGPVKTMPDSFPTTDKQRLALDYSKAIQNIVIPSYQKLYDFFEKEYLPAARTTNGIGAVSKGNEYYNYCIRYWTTTNLTPDSIYHIGQNEVERLQGEMNKVKDETGYKGDLKSFFDYVGNDKQFCPFTTPQQVLDSFWNIKKQEDPQLKKLFTHVPKAPFTIRQTEAFRAASASAEYNPASEDGTRPGIFYVPILNAEKFNAVGMETLFLHEAIPGHHYQICLQQENKDLPKFRRFSWYGAYGEGWALYSETLGKELGLFKNPYQYFGHLSDAMHRAIRLVVDAGMHSKNMTREQAIAYMMEHERISDDEATAEIERYMAIPGQALSYKIGQMSISAQRKKYEEQMGAKFSIASFHDEILKNGCLPLNVLDARLQHWAQKQ